MAPGATSRTLSLVAVATAVASMGWWTINSEPRASSSLTVAWDLAVRRRAGDGRPAGSTSPSGGAVPTPRSGTRPRTRRRSTRTGSPRAQRRPTRTRHCRRTRQRAATTTNPQASARRSSDGRDVVPNAFTVVPVDSTTGASDCNWRDARGPSGRRAHVAAPSLSACLVALSPPPQSVRLTAHPPPCRTAPADVGSARCHGVPAAFVAR